MVSHHNAWNEDNYDRDVETYPKDLVKSLDGLKFPSISTIIMLQHCSIVIWQITNVNFSGSIIGRQIINM